MASWRFAVAETVPGESHLTVTYVLAFIVVLALAIKITSIQSRRARRRQEEDNLVPVSTAPPKIERKGDRFIVEQIGPHLGPGETVTHQGYAISEDMRSKGSAWQAKAYYVALTPKRLYIVEARVGAFRPLFENRGLKVIDRSEIGAALRDDCVIKLYCSGGRVITLFITPSKHFSNQTTLLRDLPRVLHSTGAMSTAEVYAGYNRPS